MKAIRYSLYAIGGLLVLLVLGVAVFAMTFDPNRYKGQIETLVKDKTGRTLKLSGDLQLDRSAVTYIDKVSGQELAVSDLKLSTGKIAEKADGKLDLKATAKGKNPDLDVKLDVTGGYKFDLAAKSFSVSKLDAKLNGAAAGITNLSVNAKGDVAANPDQNEYRVNGLALDVKGVQD